MGMALIVGAPINHVLQSQKTCRQKSKAALRQSLAAPLEVQSNRIPERARSDIARRFFKTTVDPLQPPNNHPAAAANNDVIPGAVLSGHE